MKFAWFAIAALAACVFAEGRVVTLTDKNFDEIINNSPLTLVKFYAPWCGHCKKLAPEFVKAADIVASDEPKITLAEVDCTVEKETASRFGISGYPTLKVFRYGKEENYGGNREADGIVQYMRKINGPAAKEMTTAEQLRAFVSAKGSALVLFPAAKPEETEKFFMKFAEAHRGFLRFAVVRNAELAKAEGIEGPKIVAMRDFEREEPKIVYEGENKDADLIKFIGLALLPAAGMHETDTTYLYGLAKIPRLVVFGEFDKVNDPSGYRYVINRLKKAGKNFVGKVHMSVSRREGTFHELNFKTEHKYSIAFVGADDKKYKTDLHEVKPELVAQAVQDFLDGKYEEYIRSQDVPETQDGPVHVVVGKTFEQDVLKSGKDVMIVAYAPWCGHCKALHPKYEELAKKLAPYKDQLTIAKIDATENQLPANVHVSGYPTIMFFKAGNPEPLMYNGGREVDEMEKYIRAHVTKPLDEKAEL